MMMNMSLRKAVIHHSVTPLLHPFLTLRRSQSQNVKKICSKISKKYKSGYCRNPKTQIWKQFFTPSSPCGAHNYKMTKIQIQNMLKVQFQSLQKSKTKIFVNVFEYNIYSTPLPHLAAPTITKCQQDLIQFFWQSKFKYCRHADQKISEEEKKFSTRHLFYTPSSSSSTHNHKMTKIQNILEILIPNKKKQISKWFQRTV